MQKEDRKKKKKKKTLIYLGLVLSQLGWFKFGSMHVGKFLKIKTD